MGNGGSPSAVRNSKERRRNHLGTNDNSIRTEKAESLSQRHVPNRDIVLVTGSRVGHLLRQRCFALLHIRAKSLLDGRTRNRRVQQDTMTNLEQE